MKDEFKEEGPILRGAHDIVYFWTRFISFFTLPVLSGAEHLARRDIVLLCFPGLAAVILMQWGAQEHALLTALCGGFATFRILSIVTSTTGLLVFEGTVEPRLLPRLSHLRIRRLIILMSLLYVELMFLFAVCYRWAEDYVPHAVAAPHAGTEDPRFSAFFLSMSTMTTVGYGNDAPSHWFTMMVATIQALLSVVLIVATVALLVAYLKDTKEQKDYRDDYRYVPKLRGFARVLPWVRPPLGLLIISSITYLMQNAFR